MNEKIQQSFLRFCKTNQFEINPKQVEIINLLENFISIKKRFFNIFKKDIPNAGKPRCTTQIILTIILYPGLFRKRAHHQ